MSETEVESHDFAALNKVARGQKIIIGALLVVVGANLVEVYLQQSLQVTGVIRLLAVLVGIYGFFMIAAGLKYSLLKRAIIAALFLCPFVAPFAIQLGFLDVAPGSGLEIFLTVVPFIDFMIFLLVVNSANKALKRANYKVGFLGAKER